MEADESGGSMTMDAPELTFPPEVADHVRTTYAGARSILEYGSGGSTMVAAATGATVLSVESDRDWAARMERALDAAGADPARVRVRWCDVGPTRRWGFPETTRKWQRYPDYALAPWEEDGVDPDVVLIDGRFRLACFAAVLLHARRETTVLFDDFHGRPAYAQAESLCSVSESVGRMAVFRVAPREFSRQESARVVRWFFRLR